MKQALLLPIGFLIGSLMSKTNFSFESILLCIVWGIYYIVDFIEWVEK